MFAGTFLVLWVGLGRVGTCVGCGRGVPREFGWIRGRPGGLRSLGACLVGLGAPEWVGGCLGADSCLVVPLRRDLGCVPSFQSDVGRLAEGHGPCNFFSVQVGRPGLSRE